MKPIFDVTDFFSANISGKEVSVVTNLANAKINKLIESWPVVYGSNPSPSWYIEGETEFDKSLCTRKARLAFIEELPKEECKHQPVERARIDVRGEMIIGFTYTCKHCGCELVAEWKPKPSGGVE